MKIASWLQYTQGFIYKSNFVFKQMNSAKTYNRIETIIAERNIKGIGLQKEKIIVDATICDTAAATLEHLC